MVAVSPALPSSDLRGAGGNSGEPRGVRLDSGIERTATLMRERGQLRGEGQTVVIFLVCVDFRNPILVLSICVFDFGLDVNHPTGEREREIRNQRLVARVHCELEQDGEDDENDH